MRSMNLPCPVVAALLLVTSMLGNRLSGADDGNSFPEDVWISCVKWLGDDEIVGTKSQGLLLRPAEVVRVQENDVASFDVIGNCETSLWSIVHVDGQILGTDYKGGVWSFGQLSAELGAAQKFELESRWIRKLCCVPGEDGKVVAGSEDGQLLVLDTKERREIQRVGAGESAIFDIAFNPNASLLATAGADGRIRIFTWPELQNVSEMHRISDSSVSGSQVTDAIWSLAFTHDGTRIISGGADQRIQLWDVANARSIVTLARTNNWVTSLQLIPETSFVVAGDLDGNMTMVDLESMLPVRSETVAESGIWSIDLNKRRVAIGTRKHGIRIQDLSPWLSAAELHRKAHGTERAPSPIRE